MNAQRDHTVREMGLVGQILSMAQAGLSVGALPPVFGDAPWCKALQKAA